MPFRLGPEEEQAMLRGMRVEAQRKNKINAQLMPQTSDKISEIRQKYPWLPPGVILAAAKGDVSEELLDAMAATIATTANDDADKANMKPKGTWLSNALKGAGRVAFAGFESANELFQNALSKTPIPEAAEIVGTKVKAATGQQDVYGTPSVRGTLSDLSGSQGAGALTAGERLAPAASMSERSGEGGWREFLGATTLASLARNWGDQGSGIFVSEEIRQDQAERARKFRGTTQGGHAWTIGRGGAGMVFTEDSYAYNLMSGAIDGYVAVKMPVAPGLKQGLSGISELASADDASEFLRQAGRVSDTLQNKGQVIKVSDLTGEELKDARLLAGLVGGTVDAAKANKFFATRGGQRLVSRLVEANSTEDVWKLLNRNVYADTVKRLRDAKTDFEVQEVLADILGKPQVGLSTTKGAKGVRSFSISNARRLKMMESLDTKVGLKIKRGLGYKPGKMIDMSSTNPADVRRTLQQIDDWSKTTLMDETTRRALLDEALDSMVGDTATPTARKAFKEKFQEATIESLVKNGYTNEAAANVLFRLTRARMEKIRQSWALGPDGFPDDAGLVKNVARVNGEEVTDIAFGGPMTAGELANVIIDMPDPRQVRAMSNKLNWLWRKKPNIKGEITELPATDLIALAQTGNLRSIPAAVMFAQEYLFRRLVLMTGGYSVRNLTEAQLRIALAERDIDGAFNHPVSWLGWATHKKGAFDIRGEKFDFSPETINESMRAYREALQIENYTDFGDPATAYRRGKRLGFFDEVDRSDPNQFDVVIEAHGDQLGQLFADPVAVRLASGASEDEILTFIKTDLEGQAWFRDKQDYHINGRPVYKKTPRAPKFIGNQKIDLNIEENLRLHIDEIRRRIDYQTGSDPALRGVVASGALPPETLVIAEQRIANRTLGELITKNDEGQVIVLERMIPGSNRVGTRQVRVISVNEETGEAIVRPYAFAQGEATADLNNLLRSDAVYNNPKLVQILPHELRDVMTNQNFKTALEAWDDTTNRIFGFLYGKPSAYLDRSPVFRQFYYEIATEQLLTSLSREDAVRLYDNILAGAKKQKTSPETYVGGAERWGRIEAAANGKLPLKGDLTLDEVDAIAKGQALDDLKGFLYDASQTRNYVDAARAVFPFANAFVEFYKSIGRAYTMKTMTGVPLPNPRALRKTQLVVEGGRDGDPDRDGRGFFYTDPETGEWSFTYPGSGLLMKTFLGVPGALAAPVSGALQGVDLGQNSMFGLKLQPGLGPFAQIAASALAKVLPDNDFTQSLEKFFLPYGGTEFTAEKGGVASGIVKTMVPSWFTKLSSAIFDSDESLTAFGNAAFEMRQALIATGDYDPDNPEDMAQLEEDANFKARWLTVMRAAGQFTGPSRPTIEFRNQSIQGDVYVNQVIADLRRWQEEDYDAATLRLLDTYGEDWWAYLARKTTTGEFENISPTAEFANWENGNSRFLRQFPLVAGYFAPVGGEFDYYVYTDQIGRLRERQSDYAAFNAAQAFSVQSQMRLAQKIVGDNPTPEQEAELKAYREALEADYPGSKLVPFDPSKLSDQISELGKAASMRDMDGNPVAEGTRKYMAERAIAMNIVKQSGKSLKNKSNIEVRNLLRSSAADIIVEYPEFERLWERVLSRELD